MAYGWIVASIFSLAVAASLAEISSSYPISGSVYAWAHQMAPKPFGPGCSFSCGILTLLGSAVRADQPCSSCMCILRAARSVSVGMRRVTHALPFSLCT